MRKPVIVFTGAVYPGQFGLLCDYLRDSGLAETYFLTTPGHREKNAHRGGHILGFQPDGPIVGEGGYYYARKVERSSRIGRGLHTALDQFQKVKKIDVVVCHSLWGAPHLLFDEIDAAIVSYVEFPSYQAHGWDPDYPPDLSQRHADRLTEMLNFHQVLKSDLTICPSAYAKSMFPSELLGRIEVQFEGLDFDLGQPLRTEVEPGHRFTIGFAARDLSNAKGVDVFIRLVERLLERGIDARFVAIGDPDASTYGYEAQWVQRTYGGEVKNFCEHMLRGHPRAAAAIEFIGKLPYEAYVAQLEEIDLFLYPLRHGVGNWGLMEVLARGGCVLAPNRGYTAEMIFDDVNGRLLPDNDEAWIEEILALKAEPQRRLRYRRAARTLGLRYHIKSVAPHYMQLFHQAMENRRRRLGTPG